MSLLGDDINYAGYNIINSSLISQDCSRFLQTQLDTQLSESFFYEHVAPSNELTLLATRWPEAKVQEAGGT